MSNLLFAKAREGTVDQRWGLHGVLERLKHGVITCDGILFELTVDVILRPGGEGHCLSLWNCLAVLSSAINSFKNSITEFPRSKIDLDQERNVNDRYKGQGYKEESDGALWTFNLHILPPNIAWINRSLQFEISNLLPNYLLLWCLVRNSKNFLDSSDVIVSFVCYEGSDDVSIVLEWLLDLNLLFNFLQCCVILHLDSLTSFFKKVDHFLAVEDKIDSGEINSLNLKLLLQIPLKKQASWIIIVLKLMSEHNVEFITVSWLDVDFDIVITCR